MFKGKTAHLRLTPPRVMTTVLAPATSTGMARGSRIRRQLLASVAFTAPILPGKLEAWKQFHEQLDGLRRWDFEDQQRRLGLVRHRIWLQETGTGHVALVVQEGEDPERSNALLAASNHPFDVWFKEQVMGLHGLDLSQPLPEFPGTLFVDYMHVAGRRGPDYDLPDFNA